jgi:hypothetical protein
VLIGSQDKKFILTLIVNQTNSHSKTISFSALSLQADVFMRLKKKGTTSSQKTLDFYIFLRLLASYIL